MTFEWNRMVLMMSTGAHNNIVLRLISFAQCQSIVLLLQFDLPIQPQLIGSHSHRNLQHLKSGSITSQQQALHVDCTVLFTPPH